MERILPPGGGDERTVLTGFLDWQRGTVRRKAEGLTDEAAHRSLMQTSPQMTVAGVLSHLRHTEYGLFSRSFPSRAESEDSNVADGGWGVNDRSVSELLGDYESECDRSRRIVAQVGLDAMQEFTPAHFTPISVRWILVHAIEETARHLGHLDILREQLDGVRGY